MTVRKQHGRDEALCYVNLMLSRQGKNLNDLCEAAGIERRSLYAKLKGERPVFLTEFRKIAGFLGLDEDESLSLYKMLSHKKTGGNAGVSD